MVSQSAIVSGGGHRVWVNPSYLVEIIVLDGTHRVWLKLSCPAEAIVSGASHRLSIMTLGSRLIVLKSLSWIWQ
jgi:hypothetical protein